MKPRIPPTYSASQETPACEPCARAFLAAFQLANMQLPLGERAPLETLQDKAWHRARAVKFKKEWCCPRCTLLPTEEGQQVFLDSVYPNRRARRLAGQKLEATDRREARAERRDEVASLEEQTGRPYRIRAKEETP